MKQSNTIGQTLTPTGCDIFQAFGTATTCLHTPTRLSRCADEKHGEKQVFTCVPGEHAFGFIRVDANIQHKALLLAAQQRQRVGVRGVREPNAGSQAR
jgi:hypothetical protein